MGATQAISGWAGMLGPLVGLLLLAVALPRLLAGRFGPGPLAAVAAFLLAALLRWAVAAGLFLGLYALRDARVLALAAAAPAVAAAHFGRLGAMAGLVWLPVLILAQTALPGRAR